MEEALQFAARSCDRVWLLLGQERPGLQGVSVHPGARQRQRRG